MAKRKSESSGEEFPEVFGPDPDGGQNFLPAIEPTPESALEFLSRLVDAGAGKVAILARNSKETRSLLLELQRVRGSEGTLSLDRCRWGFPSGTVFMGCFQAFHLRSEAKWKAALITPGAPGKLVDALRRRLAPGAEVLTV